jgi:hypothetical protein
MKILPLIAGASLLGLGLVGLATPTFAASISSCQDEVSDNADHGAGQYSSFVDQDSTALIAALKDKGVNATDISDWGGCLRADVVRKDGRTAMEFFDPDTLQRLHVNGG